MAFLTNGRAITVRQINYGVELPRLLKAVSCLPYITTMFVAEAEPETAFYINLPETDAVRLQAIVHYCNFGTADYLVTVQNG